MFSLLTTTHPCGADLLRRVGFHCFAAGAYLLADDPRARGDVHEVIELARIARLGAVS